MFVINLKKIKLKLINNMEGFIIKLFNNCNMNFLNNFIGITDKFDETFNEIDKLHKEIKKDLSMNYSTINNYVEFL